MRRIALLLALLASLSACDRDFFDPTPGGTAAPPPTVELIGRNIRLLTGEANAIRISFRPKDPSVRVRISRSSTAGRVIACPLRRIDDPISSAQGCLPDLPDGVRENLTATGIGAVALVREGAPITINDLRLEYEEGERALSIRIPVISRPPGASVCKDNACNPFFEVRPVRGGRFTATARWTGGAARLELLEGRVLARALSSTGIPYRIAATATGPSSLTIGAQMNEPSEYALAISNLGTGDLTGIAIDATWP